LVRERYPGVELTPEVEELNVVGFETGELIYVDWRLLKETIDFLRTIDPLNGNMDLIIKGVLYAAGRS
jgi:hypothetical protein